MEIKIPKKLDTSEFDLIKLLTPTLLFPMGENLTFCWLVSRFPLAALPLCPDSVIKEENVVLRQECSFSPPARLLTGDTRSCVDGWLSCPVWE